MIVFPKSVYVPSVAYNPAVTGASRYVNVSGNFRDQWHGWRGAPRTTAVNIHNYFDALRSGVEITVSHNEMGLEQNLNIKALYAYHVILSEKSYLSLGISGGILHRYFDRDKIYSEDMTDTDLLLYLDKKSYVDFDFGIEYNTEHFIARASITHLTNAQQKDGMMYIERHYYAFAKYLFQLNPD